MADVSIKARHVKVVKATEKNAVKMEKIREMIRTHEALRIKIGKNCVAKRLLMSEKFRLVSAVRVGAHPVPMIQL